MVVKRKKVRIRYKKERVLLSDVLPYELPFIFSNRYFYRFLVKNKIEMKGDKLTWDDSMDEGAKLILKCISGVDIIAKRGEVKVNNSRMIPFSYTILHKPTKHRELSIMHPLNQIKVVDFYDKYKSMILYLCSLSHFSIRHPKKVATCFYYRDKLHHILLGKRSDPLEMFYAEYENLKTFFSYEKYSNIYKFYESYRYQRAEKKFEYMMKLDIESCFDSIYTHSVEWAIYGGKDVCKDHIKLYDATFGGVWDKMMQNSNYGETNGIIIGPEFSRLFAEVILQRIDQNVEQKLRDKGYKHNVDYECHRYVDDYFFFYNDDKVKEEALKQFEIAMKVFKLRISGEKTKVVERPFVTEITKAKVSIVELLDNVALFFEDSLGKRMESKDEDVDELDKDKNDKDDGDNYEENTTMKKLAHCLMTQCYTKFHSNEFCAKFKKVISDNGVEYKDVLNYTLAKLCLRIERQLKKFDKLYKPLCVVDEKLEQKREREIQTKKDKLERTLTDFLLEVIDMVFFLYAANKRVNTTLRTLQILNEIIIYLDNDYRVSNRGRGKENFQRFSEYIRETIFKKIRDEISLVLRTAPLDEYVQLETMYFLILMKQLNKKYQLNVDEIKKYLKVTYGEDGVTIKSLPKLNAISTIILFYYFGNKHEFEELKDTLVEETLKRFDACPKERVQRFAEYTILALDLATCPYIVKSKKVEFLKKLGLPIPEGDKVVKYLKHQKYMFTKWTGVNVTKEIGAKISHEVYS